VRIGITPCPNAERGSIGNRLVGGYQGDMNEMIPRKGKMTHTSSIKVESERRAKELRQFQIVGNACSASIALGAMTYNNG